MENQPINKAYSQTAIFMDTLVSIKVVTVKTEAVVEEKISEAYEVFRKVEAHCSRFDPNSELRQLSSYIGTPVKVTELLYQAVQFALEMAALTEGAFDPTIGATLEVSGFNKNYLTGEKLMPSVEIGQISSATYRDVQLNDQERTITLIKPLILDLGAVAKGLAIDLAANVLQGFEGFAIDAGGDVYVSGLNEKGQPWQIGIRDPINKESFIDIVQLTEGAICTSGSYERVSKVKKETHHLMDPKSKNSAKGILSCTAMAPFAMLADAFSTAAFILGEKKGIQLFEDNGIKGLIMTSSLQKIATEGWVSSS
jgi:thiamine biosynthesis lipoprotein